MTRKFAINETKKLWTEIKKSGLSKFNFLRTENGKKWVEKNYHSHCPLCDYTMGEDYCCDDCPLVKKYVKACGKLGYSSWYFTEAFYDKIMGL